MRAHLLSLVAAIAIPLLGIAIYSIYDDTERAISDANTSILTLATIVAANTSQTLASNRERLEILARRPRMRAVDERHCDPVLDDFRELFPRFANLTTIDLNGRAVCSAVPQPGGKPVDVLKTEWFQRALAEKRFLAGKPFRGPITGRWVSVLVSPIRGEKDELRGFMGLPLDLGLFDPNIANVSMLPGSRYGIISGDGTVIWRNVDPEEFVGRNRTDLPAVRRMLEIRHGTFLDYGADGRRRYFAVMPIPEADWYGFVSVSADVIHGKAFTRALRGSALAIVGMIIIAGLAVILARRIEKPMKALAAAAHAVKSGDADARAVAAGPQEVVDVATEFNAMVDAWSSSARQLQASENRYRTLFTGSRVAMLLIDPADDRIVDANPAACDYYGFDPAVLKAMRIVDINVFDVEQVHADIELARDGKRQYFECVHRLANGELRNVEVASNPIEIDGRTLLLSMVLDVTERKRAEREREQYIKFFTASSDLMGIADPRPDGRFQKINAAFVKTLGYPEDEILAKPFIEFVHPDDRRQSAEDMARQLKHGFSLGLENRVVCKDGSLRWLSWRAEINPSEGLMYTTARDVTDRKRMEAELREMATTDFLTGLYTRRQFMVRMEEQLARVHRRVTGVAGILMLDLDHFKRVNDTYGHATGDAMLRHFSGVVAGALRKIDTAGRLGGEEFGIILPGTDSAAAAIFAERLRKKVAGLPLMHGGQAIPVTVSIGITQLSGADTSVDAALARADEALYRAKGAGRNRVEILAA